MNKFTTLLMILLVSGCVSYPKPIPSQLIGDCKRILVNHHIWETNLDDIGFYKGKYIISTEIYRANRVKIIGTIQHGTRVEIYQVLEAANGSNGRFLRVRVKILDGDFSGKIADVPLKSAPYHPGKSWIMNYTRDPNALEFDNTIVKSCD